ncbi:bro10 [Heliothis virescens ascovirus 3i]|nr:bro10 [Heliothis virescens ascovirus 3i]
MSIIKKSYKISDNQSLDVHIYVCDSGIHLFKAKDIAQAMEFVDTDQAIRKNVDDCDKIVWSKIPSVGRDLAKPPNWHPRTLFINQSGLFSLMLSSRSKEAKVFRHWVTSEVLPSIWKTGRYNWDDQSSAVAEYNKKLSDAQVDIMKAQLEVAKLQTSMSKHDAEMTQTVAKYDAELSAVRTELALRNRDLAAERSSAAQKLVIVQRECDLRVAEIRERFAIKEIENARLMATGNTALNQLGGTALLVRDTAAYGERLRNRLNMVNGRVVPDIRTTNPDKFHCLVIYYMTVGGVLRLIARRIQIAQHMRDVKLKASSNTPRRRQRRMSTSDEYLLNGTLLVKRDCPNPLILWNKIRDANPLLFYGVRYVNGTARTECEFMNEAELRVQYESEDETTQAWLKTLGVSDADECVAQCHVSHEQALARIKRAVDECDDQSVIDNEVNRPPCADTASYTAEEVYDAVSSIRDRGRMVNITNNYNFFGSPPRPSLVPPPPPPPPPYEQ